jgi:hypothetical protein
MADEYKIHLNFLPTVVEIEPFTIYRQKRSADAKCPCDDVSGHRLPSADEMDATWVPYWVSPIPRDGFEPFTLSPKANPDITKRWLFLGLRKSSEEKLPADQLHVPDNKFTEELSITMRVHPEGQELFIVRPYLLKATHQFGLLVDFHFRLANDAVFNRKVQQLSLSLDRHGKRNLDYYVDRMTKIRQFIDERWSLLSTFWIPGTETPIQMVRDFMPLPAERLASKVYVFGSNRESRSQFQGLRDHGPLTPLAAPPKLLFVFRERDRHAARTLALALRGSLQKPGFAFPGFSSLFKTDLDVDHDPVVLTDFSEAEMTRALERAKEERKTHPNLLAILILPDGEDNGYLIHKALFSHSEIPTQVCTLRILSDPDTLKWAVSNLALQVFCKAGGQPWKVRPTPNERSLIIGISQSHKLKVVNERTQVEKYFAFSVLTDSSGLFEELQVLGESRTEDDYLSQLRQSLARILKTNSESFARVVVHTSFKLKYKEMKAIETTVQQAVKDISRCRFAVVKVNHKSRFFGINRAVNSLVPFEATEVRLGGGEYLVWFEGIYPNKPTVTRPFPGPTHLKFLHFDSEHPISSQVLLQDLVNLSGANWRGFNAKSAPVSVFYCHLIAALVHNFHEHGLPLPAVKDIRPWFL